MAISRLREGVAELLGERQQPLQSQWLAKMIGA
jgi:hypothetical protein